MDQAAGQLMSAMKVPHKQCLPIIVDLSAAAEATYATAG
jgi:hypothetical protein